ncbi:hypothetical protein EYZ11_010174 [Aspergillus tanneri]|uniref:Uncharacterized protein n=1 Tax=Aspergillus tanneri TaxID=1220188 RepID=A0A4S3J614_9EURO|nr:hypothetical protein EYZ11_010174 [Aspergillus tanneri]
MASITEQLASPNAEGNNMARYGYQIRRWRRSLRWGANCVMARREMGPTHGEFMNITLVSSYRRWSRLAS